MDQRELRELVDTIAGLSPETCDREMLGRAVSLNAKLKAFAAHFDMRCNRRANELAAHGESEAGFFVLLSDGNGSGRDAKHAEDRDRVCSDLPEFEDALMTGAVSGEHLDVLARHTKDLNDVERCELHAVVGELVTAATSDSASLFERRAKNMIAAIRSRNGAESDVEELDRQRAASSMKRWTDKVTGMKMTLLSLDPLRDAALHGVIDAQLAHLRQDPANAAVPFEQLKVNAVVATVSAQRGALGVPEVVVHVDANTTGAGRHEHTLCETVDGVPVPVASMHRFCCEAAITAVIVNADGTVRNLAEQRTANRAQRRALSAMYATCAHPHCQVPFSKCRIHHIVWWTKGGQTVLGNLIPVCEEHHHLVHEGGWSLTMTDDRTVTWLRPDGTLWLTDHSPNRRTEPAGDRHRQRDRCPPHAARVIAGS